MLKIAVEEAVGKHLAHDITRIVPGEFKGPAFKKGHRIEPGDVEKLLDLGKRHIYILELPPGFIHEDEAAERLGRCTAGEGIRISGPHEGKVTLEAKAPGGLLKVDESLLLSLNSLPEVIVATLRNNQVVVEGQVLGGARVIPLVVRENTVQEAEALCAGQPRVMRVLPIRPLRAGVLVTGSEVASGRIKDAFGPVVEQKLSAFGCPVLERRFVTDDIEAIRGELARFKAMQVEMILVCGGMSVDPDDLTPAAIAAVGAHVVSYGAPVLPGSMFLLAYWDGVPVMGLPGSVMMGKATAFDLVLPRVLAGEKLVKQDFCALGYGGYLTVNKP
ncbi:MAG: molybdopterin-binding protein [Firmicutes bacterium]|nr:molybdopterin-binding protein [Bacillota bacterium]